MKISRRKFIKLTTGSIAAASTLYLFWEKEKLEKCPEKLITRFSTDYQNADDVVSNFVELSTPLLMASYSVFYPDFLLMQGIEAIKELKIAKNAKKLIFPHDHHRLDALPAVAATHLLPVSVMQDHKNLLFDEIVNGLNDSRREVREIIVQNLITSSFPNVDTLEYYFVNKDIINCLSKIISEAEDNQKLLMPASLCVEFLLNARLVLFIKNRPFKKSIGINRLINKVSDSKADHFWFLKKMIKLHYLTFGSSMKSIEKILPQSTETLMGWKYFKHAQDYISHLILIRAKLAYTNLLTASGKLENDEVMNSDQAKRSLPRSINFFKEFDLFRRINNDAIWSQLPHEEHDFLNFYRKGEFIEILRNSDKMGVNLEDTKSKEYEINLSKCVPFSQFDRYKTLQKLSNIKSKEKRQFLIKALDAGCNAAVAGYSSYKGTGLLYEIISKAFNMGKIEKRGRTLEELYLEGFNSFVDREKEIDNKNYKGIEQQKHLDNVDF